MRSNNPTSVQASWQCSEEYRSQFRAPAPAIRKRRRQQGRSNRKIGSGDLGSISTAIDICSQDLNRNPTGKTAARSKAQRIGLDAARSPALADLLARSSFPWFTATTVVQRSHEHHCKGARKSTGSAAFNQSFAPSLVPDAVPTVAPFRAVDKRLPANSAAATDLQRGNCKMWPSRKKSCIAEATPWSCLIQPHRLAPGRPAEDQRVR